MSSLSLTHVSRIAVFNSHWQAFGGGESHSLTIAAALTANSSVELISYSDFDIDALGTYFAVDTSRLTKRVVLPQDETFSAGYDLFVNASFNSRHVSLASKSLYVVYFPFRNPSASFLRAYIFLPVSAYSLYWIRKRWGDDVEARILYPAMRPSLGSDGPPKERIILSVGRFTATGNCKRQHELIEAFRRMRESHFELHRWRLLLFGSLNAAVSANVDYLLRTRALAADLDVEIGTNVTAPELAMAFAKASVYWHMAGLGVNEQESPEALEHFGIAVVEAVANGCWPIVYSGGGPKEIVEILGYGDTAHDENELIERTIAAVGEFPQRRRLASAGASRLTMFSREQLRENLSDIIAGEIGGSQDGLAP